MICQNKNLCGFFLICKNSQKWSRGKEFSKFAWTTAPDAPNMHYLSPWSSPIILVPKKNESNRLCIDFRKLNAHTVKESLPLPRIDEVLDSLHCARWFSTLNLLRGY